MIPRFLLLNKNLILTSITNHQFKHKIIINNNNNNKLFSTSNIIKFNFTMATSDPFNSSLPLPLNVLSPDQIISVNSLSSSSTYNCKR